MVLPLPGRFWTVSLSALCAVLLALGVQAEDWPTFRHDVSRTGTTAEQLDATRLGEAWVHEAAEPPLPAWPGPARWDAYAAIKDLPSMRNYDPCYHTIAVGGAVYFGSSTNDSVTKLDAETGEVVWTFTTGGPIRIAPMVHEGKVYFGSDDGAAYCVDAETGDEVWRFDVTPGERMVLNNGRAIAFHPVRTGVVVRDGIAYFGASLLPWKESYLVGVDAQTGEVGGAGTFRQRVEGQTMEGAMLATDSELILPQGRVAPMRFDRATGEANGSLGGGGGVFVVITADQHILRQGQARAGGLVGNDQVAQYSRGHALVVSGIYGFLLDLENVIGLDMAEGKELWRHKLEGPADLVLAGDTLYVGSNGRVSAYNAVEGTRVWSAEVSGTAHGLVVANGALLVSTDAGTIHCFVEAAPGSRVAEEGDDERETAGDGVVESPEVENVRARGLVGRWVFHRSAMRDADGASVDSETFRDVAIRDQARDLHGRLVGQASTQRINNIEAMVLDGNTLVELATDPRSANLPRREFSVEAWVRVDEAMAWGGIVGCVRDNGNDEQGWLLGFRDDKFCFGLSTEQGGALTYMTANNAFTPGGWAHVVGTYDGDTMRLYINGRFEVSSDAQGGDIVYPDAIHYVIGAYKDENEDFRMKGLLHEVRVYTNVLRDRDVTALFRAKAGNFPEPVQVEGDNGNTGGNVGGNFLAFGPYLHFTAPGEAVVQWSTDRPTTGSITFVRDDETITVESARRGVDHAVTVTGLQAHAVYQYQITASAGSSERTTRSFECDTFFNYRGSRTLKHSPFFSQEEFAPEAQRVLENIPANQGFAVVAGGPDAHFAYDLVCGSGLNVICLLEDRAVVDEHRRRLVEMGLYGQRITLMHVEDMSALALPSLFANAVVVDPRAGVDADVFADQARRLIQPGGVLVHRGDLLWTAPPIEGAGDWGHMYGSADNSSFGGEAIAGAASTDDLEVQWVGRPGPRYQSDRQTRKPAPLAAGGRLYMQGLQRIICCDQYNGTILWSVEVPEMMRWNVPRDSANWCADSEHLYVAVLDEMLKIDGRTGVILERFRAAGNRTAERTWDWGYVGRAAQTDASPGVLLGTSVLPGAIFTDWWGGANWYDQQDGEMAAKVASDALFALDPATGRERWNRSEGLVLNTTITVGQDSEGSDIVYFVESRNRAVIGGDTRRLQSDAAWEGLHLVGVDAMTGREVLDKSIEPVAGTTAFYLVYSQGKLLLSSSAGNQFTLVCIEAGDGSLVWDSQFAWQANHHGKHLARPAVVGDLVFMRPKVMDLNTGSQHDLDFPDGHQCGTYTLTTNALFARAGDTMMWSVNDSQISRWNRHRPDCWISTIPAGGMVLSPEGGGGCSCGSWIETSLGWMPKATSESAGQGDGGPGE
ncbi:PQQ-binding-like beta-propeller repeat protein [Phycisphaeraceae bacterium D3-23]